MKKYFILIFATSVLLGCSKSEMSEKMVMCAAPDEYVEEVSASEEYDESGYLSSNKTFSAENSQPIINKKIIKTGSIEIQSENVQKSRKELEGILNNTKSYVQDERSFNYDYREGFFISVRVPNQNFDSLLNSLNNKGIGIIRSKNISSNDVTEDYYDTELRLKNKMLYLEKYRDFLAKAKSVKDMLEVQEKIRNLEEEIESAKGKLRFIDDKVNFSTLRIDVYKEKPNISGSSELGFFARLWQSIVTGWNVLTDIFFGILTIWPIWIIIGVAVWGIIKLIRIRKNRKNKN